MGRLILATIGVTVLAVVAERRDLPLVELGLLVPERVWHGQLWRLITWAFLDVSPIDLIFTCLSLYWFGRDLARAWGERRFLGAYLGIAVGAGVITCLMALVWPELWHMPCRASWPLSEALVIAWATVFPDRKLRIYFIFPVGGPLLVWITVGGTLLFAAFSGVAYYTPHLAAEGLMLAHLYGFSPRKLWLRVRLAWMRRRLTVVKREDGRGPYRKDDDDGSPSWMN